MLPVVLAKTAVDLLRNDPATGDGVKPRHPKEATQTAIDLLPQKVAGEAGCIALDKDCARSGSTSWMGTQLARYGVCVHDRHHAAIRVREVPAANLARSKK